MARDKQINQKRIAAHVGLSQATVSMVLSGRGNLSEKTNRRVLRAARELGYRPNLLVRGMQTGKSRMIGVMMPPFDFYWSEVIYGIHDVLAMSDHVPITLWATHVRPLTHRADETPLTELEQVHRLLDRRVDGVIVWPRFAELFREHMHEFSSRKLPVVTIDQLWPANEGADFVGSDDAAGGEMAATHLLELGHRRLGHLAGPASRTWANVRREAFEATVGRTPGASCVTFDTPRGDPSLVAIDAARQLLASPERPTAIFAASDFFAQAVYQAAREANLRIPEDLSVVGFSDDGFAAEMQPPLTTFRQPAYEVGRRAAEIVLGRSSGTLPSQQILEKLPVSLVIRQSTDGPSKRH